MMIEKREQIYEGKAKKLYTTDDPDLLIQFFKDDATAFNAQKRGTILEKGIFNNKISERIFKHLAERGVPTHLVKRVSDREMVVKRLKIFPIEVIVRNIAAGSLTKNLGIPEGTELDPPVLEFCYKNDALGDPQINESHILAMKLATDAQIGRIKDLALRINEILRPFFAERGMILVDFKLEFGDHGGEVVLGDEICPDTCRLWDARTREKMDKDRFRRDLGKVEEAYQEVCRRVCEEAQV
ncbi:MAG: phosphoribosylaminoimidazolesuccinocarboxamide synthase [Nitrospirota bacterium]|jgi:phosphoribosylaminoimidazole-succinocarboxamide synthase